MDDSQSSDFLSVSTDMFCNSPTDPVIMDTVTYESLVLNTKSAFSGIKNEIKKSTFSVYFSNLLNDCCNCISQSLDLVTELLAETSLKQNKLKEYMNDAVCLLQLLSDLIKNVIETIAMACCSMKMFPTVTGRIIMLVFGHCKDSESLYGNRINCVAQQLKDLFRTCHELQLTYLMVLEKHFIFDLTEREEQDVLIEALDINLKIAEIVESLDVKTMAEQWKAYTVICDKYSTCLMDKKIHSDSTRILCSMATNNIRIALEENQEEKLVLRSLKISSFALKILLRVFNTFKHAVTIDHTSLVELLLYIYLNNEAYLHTMRGKSPETVSLVNNNITGPAHTLLNELMMTDKVIALICNYDINDISKDDKLLGMILLVISIMNTLVQKSGEQSFKVAKNKLINVVYNLLPHCHVWFNMGLKFKCEKISREIQTYGLYEYFLTQTFTLTATMSSEEMNVLEKRMLEAVLSTDCWSALFSANLWGLLARTSSRQFLLTQVISLSKMYQSLENNNLFANSPQKVHLTYTLNGLFEVMHDEDKIKVYNMFPINEDKNMNLWCCLKLYNLPNEIQLDAEMHVMEKFKFEMRDENAVDIDELLKVMNLASSCSIIDTEDDMETLIIQAWMKACPKNLPDITKEINTGTLWYYRFIEGLVALTTSAERIFYRSSVNLVKVLHIISQIVQSGCKELKLLLINILCKLATFEAYDMNKHLVDSIRTRALSELFQDADSTVKNKLFNTLRKYRTDNTLDRIVSKIVNEDDSLRETWNCFKRHGRLKKEDINLKQHLECTTDFKYCHKCGQNVEEFIDSGSVKIQKSSSNNFDFVDIDSLFDGESDAEPACKKVKLNTNEVEQIISRLETDASSLCQIKENIFTTEYLNRIKIVCNKLNNILD
ncbi:hypothetical protein PYW07_005895 [Mythimna separata]|uniref:Uncharacterized protein n=1 Tax=Mythimna separata TaxID=271217 RepID=A0AAD7YKD8_MYTSE|nr:hypothetical protein PYW07_005895 [Mythimna separata]